MNNMMARPKKVVEEKEDVAVEMDAPVPTIHDIEWTDYVLSFLTDDEKIMGNPTTDGLRRVFERVMNCEILDSHSKVVQSPSRENEMRATVEFTLTFKPNYVPDVCSDTRSVSGCADVYWGNCDKVFRNHPVAVAETRAEGRALRRALRLRKVVAAEEIASEIEDHPDSNTVNKITNNQINFIDVMSKRLDVNVKKMLEFVFDIKEENIYNIEYENAVKIAGTLAEYQQRNVVPDEILGFDSNWR